MLSSAAKIGDEASESSIKIGIVRMEEHPNYENIIKEFKNAGFEIIIHNDFKNSPRVEILEITNKNTGEVKIEKRLHITENMRFTDLEHEYGHLKQIERLGENAPPTNKEEIVTRKDGKTSQIKAKNQQGVLTAKQNAVLEYHNYLSEFLRLSERGAAREILEEHATYVENWRRTSLSKGLAIKNSSLTKWTNKYLSDLPDLIKQYEKAGGTEFEMKGRTGNYGS